MNIFPQRQLVPVVLGVGIITSFACFAALAAVKFPRPFGPWHDNTLSQLGNQNLNPDGYVLYLIGCAVAGILTVALFVDSRLWDSSGARHQRQLLTLVRLLGAVGGIALFMNAIFPENFYEPHHFWAGLLFNSFAVAALIAIPALWRRGRSNAVLIVYDTAVFTAVVLMFVFADHHWMEWIPAGLLLLFPLLLGVFTAGAAPGSYPEDAREQRAS